MNLLALIPFPYRILAIALLGASLLGYGWFKGNAHGTQKLHDYIAAQATEAVRIKAARQVVTERVVTQYVEVEGKTKIVTKTVKEEVAKYAQANRTFTLDTNWGSLHDRAALNAVPDASGGVDDAGREAPTAAEAIATVTENYARAHRTADRLDALQAWVRKQQGVK